MSTVQYIVLVAVSFAALRSAHCQREERVELWESGNPKLIFQVDSSGRKSGRYTEFSQDGKILKRANYVEDQLHGRF